MVYMNSRTTLLTFIFSARCSDGIDRHRQEWFQSGCSLSVSPPPVCSDPVHVCKPSQPLVHNKNLQPCPSISSFVIFGQHKDHLQTMRALGFNVGARLTKPTSV